MSYLVDTNVISEMVKRRPDPGVVAFLRDKRFWLSSLVFAELTYGACLLDDTRHERTRYIDFIENLKGHYQDVVVSVSLEIADISGRLRAFERKHGRVLSFADAVMAATAQHTGTILVTRNVKDFDTLNIPLFNPFSSGLAV